MSASDGGVGAPQHADRPSSASRSQSAKPPLAERLWSGVVEVAGPFFFAAGGVQSDDHLVEVVRRDPVAAGQLIRSVALFSAIGNAGVGLACSLFLSSYWSRCDQCDRPLRWWLLVQAALQVVQLPVRVVLLVSVRRVELQGGNIEECMTSLTASPAWRISKSVALVQYAWFVLGMVWWMHTEHCPNCPGISKLTASVMVLSAVRALAALYIFRVLFVQDATPGAEAQPVVVAATDSQIDALPIERFDASASDNAEAMCSICLNDYIDGIVIRRLPCGHDFHRRCVDKWLQRNKRCPLCIHAIDQPCERAEKLNQAKKTL